MTGLSVFVKKTLPDMSFSIQEYIMTADPSIRPTQAILRENTSSALSSREADEAALEQIIRLRRARVFCELSTEEKVNNEQPITHFIR